MTIDKKNMITDNSSDLQTYITKVERLSNCIKISNLINSELSIGKLLTKLMETTKKTLAADAVSMLLIDDKTKDLTFHISLGEAGEEIKEIYNLKKGQGIAGFVAETGLPLKIKDAYLHSKFSPEIDKKTNYRTKAMLCVPLKIRGEVIGVIQVINKMIKPFFFSAEELEEQCKEDETKPRIVILNYPSNPAGVLTPVIWNGYAAALTVTSNVPWKIPPRK